MSVGALKRGSLSGTVCSFLSPVIIGPAAMCVLHVSLVSAGVVCVWGGTMCQYFLPHSVCVSPLGVRAVLWLCVLSLLQVRWCVFLCVPVPAAGSRVLLGDLQALALLVLPTEPPQLGAPMLPPVEGESGAVCHQPLLAWRPAAHPFLRADKEEAPTHLQGGAAAAEVTVGHPESLLTPAYAR